MKIAFTEIDVSEDGWIRCNVTREETEQLRIELPYSFKPAPDLIAATYSSLCGTAFDEVRIDLPLGRHQAASLENNLKAKLVHNPGIDNRHRPGSQNALNFSGGFDSLAAKELLPDSHLVSLDFGGSFSRERKFFERFNPLIFRTNLTALKMNRYSWQFMGIGSILLRDELQLDSYSFGSITAGLLPRLFSTPLDQSTAGIPAANALGMVQNNPVIGLTEIGALSLVVKNHPEILIDSLRSVALPVEDKFQRKYQMLEAVTHALGIPIRLPDVPNRSTSIQWGSSSATDLSSLFVIKELGVDHVAPSYTEGIPTQIVAALESIDMSFMLRFNPQAYAGVELKTLTNWYSTLVSNGITPYHRKDWEEIAKVMRLLRGEY